MLIALGRARAALARAAPALSSFTARRSLFIKIEPTPNPDSLKFLPEAREVLPAALGTGVHFASAADAAGSKLARALLKYPQITGVFFGRDFVSVNKVEDARWDALKPIVLGKMMDAFAELDASGAPIIEALKPAADTAPSEDDSEVVSMIKELIETRIRPAVQEDGGDIIFECVFARGWRSGARSRPLTRALPPLPARPSPAQGL
jgi:hypothetical protein